MAMDYKNAGVDIEAGYESVELMKKFVKGTMRPEVLGGLGGFSGAFSLKAMIHSDTGCCHISQDQWSCKRMYPSRSLG